MKGKDKRIKILRAAEEIISQKGFPETTISEIARKAGIGDSVIYQFFKGKEDLLFSIPDDRMKEILGLLHEHLQGIRDPESRLNKMIWFYLRHMDINPNYGRILLLDCLFSRRFYASVGYQSVRKFSGILHGILKEGTEDGRFQKDLDVALVRDVVLGTLGCEAFACLALGEVKETIPDMEQIMSLLHAMINPREESELSKPDRILKAAEKVFAQKGFIRAKVSEIAKLAQVAEGTVYEYFKNKEDLLLSIPEKRFKGYLDQLPDLFHVKSPVRKLRRFIRYYFSLFLKDREFLEVFLLEILVSFRFRESKVFESYKKYFGVIEEIIEEGKADGSFRKDVSARVFRNMFIGTFNGLALRWCIISQEKNIDKMQVIEKLADLFCSAVEVRNGT